MKLLTPEEMDEISVTPGCACLACRMHATIKAACERLARVEKCSTCEQHAMGNNADMDKINLYITGCCPNCKGTGLAHKDWQAALRSLGDRI